MKTGIPTDMGRKEKKNETVNAKRWEERRGAERQHSGWDHAHTADPDNIRTAQGILYGQLCNIRDDTL